jgi:hypothetical protein
VGVVTVPDPARLAALDQRLADLNAQMDKHLRAVMRSDIGLVLVALGLIAWALAARPAFSLWEFAASWGVIILLAVGSLFQGLMLRNYRAEIRDLRARVPRG